MLTGQFGRTRPTFTLLSLWPISGNWASDQCRRISLLNPASPLALNPRRRRGAAMKAVASRRSNVGSAIVAPQQRGASLPLRPQVGELMVCKQSPRRSHFNPNLAAVSSFDSADSIGTSALGDPWRESTAALVASFCGSLGWGGVSGCVLCHCVLRYPQFARRSFGWFPSAPCFLWIPSPHFDRNLKGSSVKFQQISPVRSYGWGSSLRIRFLFFGFHNSVLPIHD